MRHRHHERFHDHLHEQRHHALRKLRTLRRSPDNRVLGGVCGAVSNATGIDATWVRIGFVLLAIASGVMVFVYAMAWLLIPMAGETSNIYSRAINDRRGIRLIAAILIPLLIAVQIITGILHVPFVGFVGWPTFLAVGVVVLIWRNANESEKAFIDNEVVPLLGADTHGLGRRWLIARVLVGILIGAGGIALLVAGHTTLAALRPVGGAALVIAASVIIFGPWWLSLVRDLIAERQARALAEERAQMAAHVHDSVLQTLALIQRSSDDPQHVVTLARAQERELRAWLFEGKPPGAIGEDATMLGEGVGLLQRQVEADHGITVQVVMVGDCELDEALRALLDAAREATVNSAKWSGAEQVSVYAEVEADTVMLYVRDRGRGFDPAAVPEDRQGIAQSIRARMARFGGSADVRSAPGEGAEVQLSMPRRERVS
jgi:signal transduction histidine kinase